MKLSLCRFLLALCASVFTLAVPSHATVDDPVTGPYPVVIIRVTYADNTARLSSVANLNRSAGELHDFFSELSFGQLNVTVRYVDVALRFNVADYWDSCGFCVRPNLMPEATELAGVAGINFAGVKAVAVLSPCSVQGGFTEPDDAVLETPHAHGTVHQMFLRECGAPGIGPRGALPPPGPSGVWWSGWVHELGHTLQLERLDRFPGNLGHPAGYGSHYDLMDSCYPCGDSVFDISGNPVVSDLGRNSFPGYLPSSKTLIIERPLSGAAGGTYVLESLFKPDPGATTAYRGIKIPLGGDHYYIVEARTRVGADSHDIGPGIWDEGIHILDIVESRTNPVSPIVSCDYLIPRRCVRDSSDDRAMSCPQWAQTLADSQPYCDPYALWHSGDVYYDPANDVRIAVNDRVGDGFGVTVTRGVTPGHPDVFIYPWLTAPMNTYETVDIWVDSSCNGYESEVGPAGLRYGRRPDGTVIGNGDDPCANHENRIYAHIRNGGDAVANNVHVRFLVSNPMGVGVSPSTDWTEVGHADIPVLARGGAQDVYTTWTPRVTLTDEQIREGHFNFHTCVQIKIDAVAGEVILSNQDGDGEQENFDHFEAVRDHYSGGYHVPDHFFYLYNHQGKSVHNVSHLTPGSTGLPERYRLRVKADMPPDWRYQVANGEHEIVVAPEEVRQVPVRVLVPPGTPVAKTFYLRVTAFEPMVMTNTALPESNPYRTHAGFREVAGVVEAVQTVDPSTITITRAYKCPEARPTVAVLPGSIHVRGHLDPAHNHAVIAVDYARSRDADPITHTVFTDADGNFEDGLPAADPSEMQVRAFWQGDGDHSGAVSDTAGPLHSTCESKESADQPQSGPPTGKQSQPTTPAPKGSTLLLPEQAFSGGVLTGVVIGPDDQPVPNAPVQIDGGVPGTLSGVVWGDGSPTAPSTDSSKLPLPYIRCSDNNSDTANSRAAAAGGGGTGKNTPFGQVANQVVADNSRAAAAGGGGVGLTANGVGGSPIGKNTPFGQIENLVTTDASGRFAVCAAANASTVGISIPEPGNGSPVSKAVPLAADIPTPQPPFPHTPDFVQPDQRFSMPGIFPKATFEQGGTQGGVPVATAISPNGKQFISTFKAPHGLQPGPVKWTFTDQNGQQTSYKGGIFKILRASIDSSKLHSNQGADFEFEVLADRESLPDGLCVDVKLAGPISMVRAPAAQVPLDSSGHGKVGGKIRAAQVSPGSAIPFDIQPNFHSCDK